MFKRSTWYEWLRLALAVIALLVFIYFGVVFVGKNYLMQSVIISLSTGFTLFVIRKLRFASTNKRLCGLFTEKTIVKKLRRDKDERFQYVYTLKTPYAAAAFMSVKPQLKKCLRAEVIYKIYDNKDRVCVNVTSRRQARRQHKRAIKNVNTT